VIVVGQVLEVLIGGLLAGVLYSLVALGFVLIFKASGVFNFAQGAMVLLAGLALVRSLDFLAARGVPTWAAIVLGLMFAAVIMAICAWIVERYVLGPLVNQDGLTLFMSTIGAAGGQARPGAAQNRRVASPIPKAIRKPVVVNPSPS
jgi:branched-chain amino acid transport system permease protein